MSLPVLLVYAFWDLDPVRPGVRVGLNCSIEDNSVFSRPDEMTLNLIIPAIPDILAVGKDFRR